MYSLHLTCPAAEAESASVSLWEAGTVGIREEPRGDLVELIAGFDAPFDPIAFSAHSPYWEQEAEINWVAATHQAWPGRTIGQRIFLAPVWNQDPTPPGRVRVIHNPGLASGTGEHPCTQLALESLEKHVGPNSVVVDIGTGSGILSLAALRLGARCAIAVDLDFPSLQTARENFHLNHFNPTLAEGSADCIAGETAKVVVANISGTVLLSLADELIRILRPEGTVILTGFPASELSVLQRVFGHGDVTALAEWRCLTI